MRDYVDDATGDYRSQVKRFVKRMVIGILSGGLVGALFGFVIAVDFGGVSVNWPMIVITGLFGGGSLRLPSGVTRPVIEGDLVSATTRHGSGMATLTSPD